MPDQLPFDPIQLWGAFGAVVILLFLALIAFQRDWAVPRSRYKECLDREAKKDEKIAELEAELREEREKRESLAETTQEKMSALRDSLEQKLEASNRLLLEATETFQRVRRR